MIYKFVLKCSGNYEKLFFINCHQNEWILPYLLVSHTLHVLIVIVCSLLMNDILRSGFWAVLVENRMSHHSLVALLYAFIDSCDQVFFFMLLV